MENLETFRANGFEFKIEQDAAPTKRVFLTQIPHSKNWTFGKQVKYTTNVLLNLPLGFYFRLLLFVGIK